MGANFFSFRSFRTAWGDWGIIFIFLWSKGNNPTLSPAKSGRSYFHKLFKLNFVYIINNNMSFEIALANFKDGKFEESLVILNKLISKKPNQPEFHLNRGRVLSRLSRAAEAILDFDLIVELEPYNTDFMSDRAVVLHLLKRNDEALTEFDRAANLDPRNPYRYSSRAYFKDRVGDLEGAIQDYDKAIELDPEDAVAYNNRGLVEEKVGYQARAKKSFLKADDLVGDKAPETKPLSKEDSSAAISNEKGNPKNADMSLSHFWKTFRSIFSDSKTRSEFSKYLKRMAGRK
jgi:Flp pilus assembly protein TadD